MSGLGPPLRDAGPPLRVALVSEATVLDDPSFGGLDAEGFSVIPTPRHVNEAAQVASLAGCFAVVAGAEPYPRSVLEALPDLRVISRSGVGYDAIDVAAADDLGIHVTVTTGVNAMGVAEHAMSMLLALLHRTAAYDDRVRHGKWRDGQFFGELYGSTVGIVGFGRIGRNLARMMQAFDVTVLAYDPAIPEDHSEVGVTFFSSLDEMLPRCNVVTLHVPLTAGTRHLLGAEQFALLPQGAIIVNTARGPVLDESALLDALASGHLGGAALDVMETEPLLAGSALTAVENCVLSPHIASFGQRTIAQLSQRIVEQVAAVAKGKLPEGLVSTPALGGARSGQR